MHFSRRFFLLPARPPGARVEGSATANPRSGLTQLARVGVTVAFGLLLGCTHKDTHNTPHERDLTQLSKVPAIASTPRDSDQDNEANRCQKEVRRVLAGPGVPGAPEFARRRLEILMQAKAEPVILVRAPEHPSEPEPELLVRGFRELIAKTDYPWDVVKRLSAKFKQFPHLGRETLLREGYLYAEVPELAYALVNLISAEHLFEEPTIWLQRGEFIYHAERKRGRYYFIDGPNRGEEVRLLLLDRVGTGPDPDPADSLVRDVRSLAHRLHFTRAKVRHITPTHIVANLHYGPHSIPSLLKTDGARLSLECEVLPAKLLGPIHHERAETARRERVVQALRQAMLEQISAQLPFDEPRHEYGFQLDGVLRRNWRAAYFSGKSSFAYNGDRYFVFDRQGRPQTPQVCVDFLTDTLERISGTRYQPRGEVPERVQGKLDFKLDVLERAKLRRVPAFLSYARENPEQFEVLDIEPSRRIPMGERAEFLQFMKEEWRDFRPGDIVIIRGMTPWDPIQSHYHSFYVYESDPITGVPLALVGNAGRPSVRYWEVEARRTPKREIWHRLRPKTQWLESILDAQFPIPEQVPPISPPGNAG